MFLNIIIGISGGSKTNYLLNQQCDNDVIIDADDLRLQLYGTLMTRRSQKTLLFAQVNKQLNVAIKQSRNIWYNAIDGSRKQRILLYNQAKKHGYHIRIIWFIDDMQQLLHCDEINHERLSLSFFKQHLLAMDPPIINLYCDEIIVKSKPHLRKYALIDDPLTFTSTFCAPNEVVAAQLLHNTIVPDNGIYHTESLQQHLQLCIQMAHEVHEPILTTVAQWHDAGKVAVRKYDMQKHTYHYYDHEIYSSYAYLVSVLLHQHTITAQQFMISQLIRWHMTPFRGISERLIMREQLTPHMVALLKQFNQIDMAASLSKNQ